MAYGPEEPMKQPTHEGIWRVRGYRFTARRRYRVEVNDLVDVQEVEYRRPAGLAVFFFGRADPYSLEAFDAEWTPVDIEFEGERCI